MVRLSAIRSNECETLNSKVASKSEKTRSSKIQTKRFWRELACGLQVLSSSTLLLSMLFDSKVVGHSTRITLEVGRTNVER